MSKISVCIFPLLPTGLFKQNNYTFIILNNLLLSLIDIGLKKKK